MPPGKAVNMIKKITAKEAHKVAIKKGLDLSGDGVTYYAIDEKSEEIYSFDTRAERDGFIKRSNNS